ncbi:MAG TPA: phosphatase PAP2 family protein [Solirubrobacterales bacterium]
MNRAILAAAVVIALAAVGLSAYVVVHPIIPEDIVIERDVQLTSWGPLAYTFPFFSWIGDLKGAVLEVVIFILVLILNRPAWVVAIGGVLSGVWYQVGVHLVPRQRPTTALVPHVYETPGASSYPSGHTIFIVTVTSVLMLCFGYRFLPRWALPAGWVLVVLICLANGIARVYTGAHWPSDVLGGALIGAAWMTFLLSVRWVSDRVFRRPA